MFVLFATRCGNIAIVQSTVCIYIPHDVQSRIRAKKFASLILPYLQVLLKIAFGVSFL
jgi:hypothetical protein